MLWPRPRSLSASCSPCVRLESALAASLNSVRHVSTMSQPVSTLCPALYPLWLRLETLSAMYPPCVLSTMCPLKPWPCLWTLPALGLLWGTAMASPGKILSHHGATQSVDARWSVSFISSFWLTEFGLR